MEQTEEEGTSVVAGAPGPPTDTPVRPEDEIQLEPNSAEVISVMSEPGTPAGSVASGGGGGGGGLPSSTGSLVAKSAMKPALRRTSTGSSSSSKASRATGLGGGASSEMSWRGSAASTSVRHLFRESSVIGSDRSSLNDSSKILDASAHIAIKAAGEGDIEPVKAFLQTGGDVNVKSRTGASTLLSRAASRGHLAILNFLLERGAAVNMNGRGGMTPLHEAAGCGQVEACRILLGAGAAVAARDYARRCPLHYAGSSAVVTQLLLDFGADPEAKDKNGKRPDSMAVDHEARTLLRDARCAVRESGAGDNASRVIASLRRELGGREREAAAAKTTAEEQTAHAAEQQQVVEELRAKVSALTAELSEVKERALAAEQASTISAAVEAELRQAKAALRVARAAAAEERSRREEFEERFDSAVSEAVAKAIAAAVAANDEPSSTPRSAAASVNGNPHVNGGDQTDGDGAGGQAIAQDPAGAKQQQQPPEEEEQGGAADNDGGNADGPARRGWACGNRTGRVEGVLEFFCIPTRGIPPEMFCLPKPQQQEESTENRPCGPQ